FANTNHAFSGKLKRHAAWLSNSASVFGKRRAYLWIRPIFIISGCLNDKPDSTWAVRLIHSLFELGGIFVRYAVDCALNVRERHIRSLRLFDRKCQRRVTRRISTPTRGDRNLVADFCKNSAAL